ncbi:MAG TPA: hypothetical protein VLH94_02420 [Spirochaetia bacterium]|nr:hypothetical protein [Spirochaetia bacterium]
MSVQALIIKAVNIREKGDPAGALETFCEAMRLSENPIEQAEIMGQMALCYQHLNDLDMAVILYNAAADTLSQHADVVGVARMRRQLSSIQLYRGDLDGAYELALKARSSIVSHGYRPNDLCHMTHGIIKVLYKKRQGRDFSSWFSYTSEIWSWLMIEAKEIRQMYPREKSIARDVWFTGFLADLGMFFPVLTFPFGLLGYLIAKSNGLGLRVAQFKNRSM